MCEVEPFGHLLFEQAIAPGRSDAAAARGGCLDGTPRAHGGACAWVALQFPH